MQGPTRLTLSLIALLLANGAQANDRCTRATLNELTQELRVRDFLNRLPSPYRGAGNFALSEVTRYATERSIDLEGFERLLNRVSRETEQAGLYTSELEAVADEVEALQSKLRELSLQPPAVVSGDVVQLHDRATSVVSDSLQDARRSILVGSDRVEKYLTGVASALQALERTEVVRRREPISHFQDSLAQYSIHGAEIETLLDLAVSSDRDLGDCPESLLIESLYERQSTIQQIHEQDDRVLVPPGMPLTHLGSQLPNGTRGSTAFQLAESHLAAIGVLVGVQNVTADEPSLRLTARPYEEYRPLCDGERFREARALQPPSCTAFVIRSATSEGGGALIATARHCLEPLPPGQTFFVRNFRHDPNEPSGVSHEEITRIVAPVVVDGGSSTRDWAVLQLEKPLPDVSPLPLRESGEPSIGDPLFVLGHPDGLPLVIASNAEVQGFGEPILSPFLFEANVDSLGGNSGSPLLSARTGMVEGILSKQFDREPFETKDGCLRILPCGLSDCLWERVIRIRFVSEALKQLDSTKPRGKS